MAPMVGLFWAGGGGIAAAEFAGNVRGRYGTNDLNFGNPAAFLDAGDSRCIFAT